MYHFPFSKKKQEFLAVEIKDLLVKLVIVETKHEPREFVSPILVLEKPDRGFHLLLDLKRLNEVVEY